MNVSLDSIGGGVALERFTDELQSVIANILDPNTDFKIKREITLSVKFTPNEARDRCDLEIVSKSKLAPPKAVASHMMIGVDQLGVIHAEEWRPEQQSLFDNMEDDNQNDKVAKIGGNKQ